jgi:hypothetical protein
MYNNISAFHSNVFSVIFTRNVAFRLRHGALRDVEIFVFPFVMNSLWEQPEGRVEINKAMLHISAQSFQAEFWPRND